MNNTIDSAKNNKKGDIMENTKKKCFIITPIGSETDPIRRHIDGIINAAIRPALEDKYEIIVAHNITEPGSITKQIISEIYRDELVIANLTNRNPNVMYELAFRHSLGTPVIMIAEKGTNLPSDIMMERTIFYCNDAQGVLELRDRLKETENSLNFETKCSPIYDILRELHLEEKIIEQSASQDGHSDPKNTTLLYVLEKLDSIESRLTFTRNTRPTSRYDGEKRLNFTFAPHNDISIYRLNRYIEAATKNEPKLIFNKIRHFHTDNLLTISYYSSETLSQDYIRVLFIKILETFGLQEVKFIPEA